MDLTGSYIFKGFLKSKIDRLIMDFKGFLKPNKTKIIVFILSLLILPHYAGFMYSDPYGSGPIFYSPLIEALRNPRISALMETIFITIFTYFMPQNLILNIILLTIKYLLSCSIFWFYEKYKKKK